MTTKNIQDVVADFEHKFCKKRIGSSPDEIPLFYSVTAALDVKDWLTTTLTQLVKEVEAGAYQRGYEQGKFDGTMDTLHPTHAMHEPNLQAKHTGDNLK